MNIITSDGFTRPVNGERAMIMLPFNVVFAARIKGTVKPEELSAALKRMQQYHPFLGVRLELNEDESASFVSGNVPGITLHTEERRNDDHWVSRLQEELTASFPLERGPLVRCSLLHSTDVSDIILCAHHAICDGMSLGYLLRDLLRLLSGEGLNGSEPLIPPPVDESNVPTPPATRPLMRWIMSMINKKWAGKKIRFGMTDMEEMHRRFWEKNGAPAIQAWSLDRDATAGLVKKCRGEQVTVNAALWTAFLAAQYDVQEDHLPYRNHAAMAVNNRDKLLQPAGEAFGFYASSLAVKLRYSPRKSFWENARRIHGSIKRELDRTNLFRMLISGQIHHTLLDSLYFQKYGMLQERLAAKFLKKMGWHRVTYGCALTNVGRFDIPVRYGPLEIEAVHGPLFYSDVEEKMIGVITVGGKLSFLMGCSEAMNDIAKQVKAKAMSRLETAVRKTA